MTRTHGLDWWIAISNTRCERRATQGLIARGYEVWQPCQWVETRLGKGRWHACKQHFPAPGYLFVRPSLFPNCGWHRMMGVDGLRAVLCVNEEAMVASDQEITRWRSALAPGLLGAIEEAYQIGDSVRLTGGPLHEIEFDVEKSVAGGGVWVTADMLGRKVRMLVDSGQLQRAG